jgi:hypothetical protein
VKVICLSVISALSLGLAFQASAQQGAASTLAADRKYCGTLARTYQSLVPVTQLMVGTEALLLSSCDTNPRATIVGLQKKFADQHMDIPQDPASASKAGQ